MVDFDVLRAVVVGDALHVQAAPECAVEAVEHEVAGHPRRQTMNGPVTAAGRVHHAHERTGNRQKQGQQRRGKAQGPFETGTHQRSGPRLM